MAINLSNYLTGSDQLNNKSDTATLQMLRNAVQNTAAASGTASAVAGKTVLKNMLAGDTFTGLVLGVKENQVSLALGDGTTIMAELSDNIQLKAGQTVTFMVEETSENYIKLKPMAENEQQAFIINKALEGAGLDLTKDNIMIIKELLSLKMPVNSDKINEMIHLATEFPDTDYHTLANMLRLEIPVTENNIAQYEAYTHFENNLTMQLQNIESAFTTELLNTLNKDGNSGLTFSNLGQLMEFLYNSSGTESMRLSDLIGEDIYNKLAEEYTQLKDIDGFTVKQFLSTVLEAKGNEFEKLLGSDIMKEAIHQAFNETMKLTPEDVRVDNAISEYYSRIKKVIEDSEKLLNKSGTGSEILKEMNQVKANVDFMNNLNKNMTYFQMPVKFSDSEGNGELYVFTNKRALNTSSDTVSALLHLDMENLGPIDVYVKLAGKNVSTNFCLESDEMLDFVYSHIDKLNERLEKLGYSTHFEMNVTDKTTEKFNVEKDFIEKDISKTISGQYIFDSRV